MFSGLPPKQTFDVRVYEYAPPSSHFLRCACKSRCCSRRPPRAVCDNGPWAAVDPLIRGIVNIANSTSHPTEMFGVMPTTQPPPRPTPHPGSPDHALFT